ncbi:MAG: endonuclease/exonuclease/phosphatase family protein [Clostridia bacterium]|nr:endonuclease/exonuclease/phosphatase family protein [Clostridia bacterium]
METKTRSKKKTILLSIFIPLGLILALVLGYLAYVLIAYHRVGDQPELEIVNPKTESPATATEYKLLSYNIGFCAYTPDFGFFMDGGKGSRAKSAAAVCEVIDGIVALVNTENPDLLLLQEVDKRSQRACKVDEAAAFDAALPAYTSVYAINWDSPYLFFPFVKPHGAALTGIKTYSRFGIAAASRVELPVEKSLMKLVDLDRCYTVSRVPVEGGKTLVLYNFHLSAYTSDGKIAVEQLELMLADMKREAEAGNYVIGAGDFNKDLLGNSGEIFGVSGEKYTWAQPFPTELLEGTGITLVAPYDPSNPVASCRNADGPYNPDQFRITIDGFLVSGNVSVASSRVVDTEFAYSDHNPVELTFSLMP